MGARVRFTAESGDCRVGVSDDGGSDPAMQGGQGSSQSQRPLAIIPKVREQLRLVSGDLFTPRNVLIGPYHDEKEYYSFPWMEEKKKAVHNLQCLVGSDLADLKSTLAGLRRQVRSCYTHLPDDHYMDRGDDFTLMLLRDGCYLLSFFIDFVKPHAAATDSSNCEGGGREQKVLATKDNTMFRDILYLLENQIPLFVLETILKQYRAHDEPQSALECIATRVERHLQKQLYISKTTRPVPSMSTSSDLLRLLYSYFRRRTQEEADSSLRLREEEQQGRSLTGRWRRATDYSRYADLRFELKGFRPDEEWTILDIQLHGGTMYIPLLRVDSNTWTMLRNLMALEEEEEKRPVTAYCYFMSQLACTAEDVGLLQRAKVLEHFFGSDEQAAQGFNQLCDGMALDIDNLDRNYLKPFWHQLHKRCKKPVNQFKGFFREKYCGTLFHRMVFSIALFFFVTQAMQVVYAALSYHKPPK
ncbi:hypothetical protein HU200_066454 [Digitaria exilis]|uniref:Uncharacterized protein n=1 Tax=Digitaria exilis TaxID=1010633 RepID=A0A835A7N8_9POAL|nr:hypothetical protein HU200_066454 [Digitaria exilis]